MKIGIDVSQLAYRHTGVSNYLESLLSELLKDKNNQFVLFFSSLRRRVPETLLAFSEKKNVRLVRKRIPPSGLSLIWNSFHVLPIESFIGSVDIFITSDWTEPPTKNAIKATILYDLIIYKSIDVTDKKIIATQKKKLKWVKKESKIIFCISESTKKDAMEILGIEKNRLKVIYPGLTI